MKDNQGKPELLDLLGKKLTSADSFIVLSAVLIFSDVCSTSICSEIPVFHFAA